MRRAPAKDASNAISVTAALNSVGWRGKLGRGVERTFAIGATVPLAAGYRDLVLEDDEDRTDATDEDAEEPIDGHAEPAPIERFRRSSVGAVFAAGMLGLRDVLEPEKDET